MALSLFLLLIPTQYLTLSPTSSVSKVQDKRNCVVPLFVATK